MKSVRRFGKEKQRFTFSLQIHQIDLGVEFGVELSVVWTRGARTAKTDWVSGEKGVVQFSPKPLSLLCTMYKSRGQFDKKRSRLLIKQKKSSGREKQVGCVELDLANYVGPNIEHDLELPITRCSSKNAKIYFTLRCQYHQALNRDDDTVSVSSMSVVSVGSQTFEPVSNPANPPTPTARTTPTDIGFQVLSPTSDVADLSSLDDFDIPGDQERRSNTATATTGEQSDVTSTAGSLAGEAGKQPPSHDIATGVGATNTLPETNTTQTPQTPQNPFAIKQAKAAEVYELLKDSLTNKMTELRKENEELKRRALMGYGEDVGSYNEERRELMNALKLARAETAKVKLHLQMEQASNSKMKEMLEQEIAIYRSKRIEFEDTQSIAETKDRRITELTEQLNKERALSCDLDTRVRETQMELSEARTKMKEQSEMLNLAKEELAGLHKERSKMDRNYQDVLRAMEMAPNDLIKSIGFFRSQYHDLENTLLMVRKSWKETSKILQTQVTALQNELVNAKVENERLKSKAQRDSNHFRRLKSQVGKLQEEKFKLSERLSRNEVKLAQKTVDHVTSQNELTAAREAILKLRGEVKNKETSSLGHADPEVEFSDGRLLVDGQEFQSSYDDLAMSKQDEDFVNQLLADLPSSARSPSAKFPSARPSKTGTGDLLAHKITELS